MQRSTLAIILCLPGALVLGFCGGLFALFEGSGNPDRFAYRCLALWAIVGGASFGAMPGLVWGYCKDVRWVSPFLGAAAGFTVGLLSELLRGGGDVNSTGPTYAGLVLLGVIVGSLRFMVASRSAPK